MIPHWFNVLLHTPWPVLIQFRLHHCLRGWLNSFGCEILDEVGVSDNFAVPLIGPMLLACEVSQLRVAVLTGGYLDFNLCCFLLVRSSMSAFIGNVGLFWHFVTWAFSDAILLWFRYDDCLTILARIILQ